MLTKKQIKEIKEHLEKAQNPLFFFDNDADGLCSFLLLRKYLGRGKGVCVKSYPDLTKNYFKKVKELNADYIFILDKPVVSEGFWEEVEKVNIPCVWIDHHDNKQDIPKFISYYNPLFNRSKKNEPVAYLCYQISQKKEDLWVAVVGCIGDKFIPDFYKDFEKKYPDLMIKSENPFEISYRSQVGKIGIIFNFALMDRTTNVVNMLRFLIKAKSPYEVLEEGSKNYSMHQRFNQINTKYQKLLKRAIEFEKKSEKMLFFKFGGDLSISSDLSNELAYLFPKKIIVTAYVTESKANISMRGQHVRGLVLKAIEGLENATGGGHENAVGAKVMIKDLEKFKEKLEKLITGK